MDPVEGNSIRCESPWEGKGEWNELEISRLIQPHQLKFGGYWGQCQGRLPRQLAFAALIGPIELEQNEMIAYYVRSTLKSNLKRSAKNKSHVEMCVVAGGDFLLNWSHVPQPRASRDTATSLLPATGTATSTRYMSCDTVRPRSHVPRRPR